MLFNVAQLLKEPTGATRSYELIDDLDTLDLELHPLNPLVGNVVMLRTHSGILVRGELSTAVQVACNRCLAPIVLSVRFSLEESFRPLTEVTTGRYIHPDDFEGTAEDLEDEALLINEQHILDLSEVVRQNIWLSLPMYPTCDQAGLDECQNLSERLEDMRRVHDDLEDTKIEQNQTVSGEAIDPRWNALLELQNQLQDEK